MIDPSSFSTVIDRDGDVSYWPGFFESWEADECLQNLMNDVPWSQDSIKIFGRSMLQPRLTCWMGDPGVSYKYSGLLMAPKPWSATVVAIKTRVERVADMSFNSALLNFYRDGNDSMGWHRDNEKELGHAPVIISLSFGAERRFMLRRYKSKEQKTTLNLGHGSMLRMSGELQTFWEHSLPKVAKLSAAGTGPRVNITFRNVISK